MKAPRAWKNVNIRQFIAAQDLLKDESLDSIEMHVRLLSALTDKPLSALEAMPLQKLKTSVRSILFIHKETTDKPVRYFSLKGRLYKACLHPKDMTAGQWADYNAFLSTGPTAMHQMHNLLAVLCTPVNLRGRAVYKGETHEARAKLFYDRLGMHIAYPIALFFSNLFTHFRLVTETYLASELQGIAKEAKKEAEATGSVKSGDGLR